MDYKRPVEILIPGVQGRVLGVLARTEAELTIRTVASLAAASPQQASVVVARLVELGVVARREAGSAALVSLDRENEVARIVLALGRLPESAIIRLAEVARNIVPAPASLLVFGSFVRGEAGAASDLDVLAIRPRGVAADDNQWIDALGRWEVTARRIVGNPVNMLVVSIDEVPGLLRRRRGPWRAMCSRRRPSYRLAAVGIGVGGLRVPRAAHKGPRCDGSGRGHYLLKAREFLRAAQDSFELGIVRRRRVTPFTRVSPRAMLSRRHLLVGVAGRPRRHAEPLDARSGETDESQRTNSRQLLPLKGQGLVRPRPISMPTARRAVSAAERLVELANGGFNNKPKLRMTSSTAELRPPRLLRPS